MNARRLIAVSLRRHKSKVERDVIDEEFALQNNTSYYFDDS